MRHLSWFGIVRLGLVQAAIGAIVVLTTSTLNRVMVVELSLAASLPAAFVAWHYAVQVSRPLWGHRSDTGGSRTSWIIAGMAMLSLGALVATNATIMLDGSPLLGTIAGIAGFSLIGAGVAACGTTLLALLASSVQPERRPAAASITWIMMIVGIVFTAATSGAMLDPYSPQRLALVASGVAGIAFLVTLLATWGVERGLVTQPREGDEPIPFRDALAATWADPLARSFTIFVFVSMLAYSAQDLILEPYAGLVFNYTLGESTKLSGVQHSGVLVGMIMVGLMGALLKGDKTAWMRVTTIFGCLASATALAGLGGAGLAGATGMLKPAVFALGFANGIFAVSAIGLMMSFAGMSGQGDEGIRMGVWGAAQAIAFGLGGFAGALGVDVMRNLVTSTPVAFAAVFAVEASVFVVSAAIALGLGRARELSGAHA